MSKHLIDKRLWDAAFVSDEVLVSQLIEMGAVVDWKDQKGKTALHQAARNGNTTVVTCLLDSGWSLEAKTRSGNTPLRLAAWHGHLETAKRLLLRGANIDTQDNYKWTPLHYASRDGHTDLVQLLLQCGANQDIRNVRGETAEDRASKDETRSVFRQFSEKGLKTRDELFDKAVEEKDYDIASILAYSSKDSNIMNKFLEILEILDIEKVKDLFVLDFFHRSVSNNHSSDLKILQYFNNKTKYFRLRLTDKVSSERPKGDLRLTWD